MDALEVLRRGAGFGAADVAIAHVGFLPLPSEEKVGLVSIRFHDESQERVSCVSLPASTHFNAIPDNLPVPRRFDIALLDKADIDASGRIRLVDGTELRAVEVERARLPLSPTELDYRIVHLTLELMGAEQCYRSFRGQFPPAERCMVPDLYFLDVARICELEQQPPPLSDIIAFIAQRYKRISGQQIANALRKFGLRHPQPRPTSFV